MGGKHQTVSGGIVKDRVNGELCGDQQLPDGFAILRLWVHLDGDVDDGLGVRLGQQVGQPGMHLGMVVGGVGRLGLAAPLVAETPRGGKADPVRDVRERNARNDAQYRRGNHGFRQNTIASV